MVAIFNFNNDNILQTALSENVSVRIEKLLDRAIARVYFIDHNDKLNDTAAIPARFLIVDLTNRRIQMKALPGTQQFVLAWTNNYQLVYKDEIILELQAERQWSIRRTSPERYY